MLSPAGTYHCLIHRLIRRGNAVHLHASIIESGERFSVKAYAFHVTQMAIATMNQRCVDGFENTQAMIELKVDPVKEVNMLGMISKAKVLVPVQSDVVVTAPTTEWVGFDAAP